MGEMLSVKNINVFYGSIQALRDISFHVNEGEIVTLIGANGAGKTTTMHAISGLLKVQSGEIDYCGQNISKMEAHKIIRLGLAQVPEGRRVFSGLTVMQNLQMGAYTRRDGKEAIQIIRQVNRNGVTVLLVEQNAKMALEIANRAYVLETGKIKMEGEAHELANNIEVRKAYLGCE